LGVSVKVNVGNEPDDGKGVLGKSDVGERVDTPSVGASLDRTVGSEFEEGDGAVGREDATAVGKSDDGT
jgi:hypothetical protein